MTCHEIRMSLTAYVDGELDLDELEEVELHLKECDSCQQLVHELEETTALVFAQLNSVVAPLNIENRVMERIADLHQEHQVHHLFIVYLVCGFLGICGIVALLISPVGAFVRAMFHLFLAVLNGLSFIPSSLGSWWILGTFLSTLLVVGISVFGVSRLLRSLKSEVVL
ncbi:zf-HC2 domain-containing protein [Alicyclobacillus fastidiosus]|uniref:Anti-sigma-W factor RsiW n=1 Tax=Alicyclobacillus fastidiosus TaxID=392011 RepID=A0ABV5AL74_9BACL|nr:zf-HC2 domain-containing protein [Alicyclobacillus fastidiosus]WEH10064.1 zf-HC2 domain-containing protein [Alicyclobacillus fastidiosus]